MKAEAVILFLCFFAVLTAGLAGCAHTGGVAGAEKVEANYPDVWERVLPEEMRTNIANYSPSSLYSVEIEYTDLLDHAVSISWKIDEVYHIDGEDHDDVVFRFSDSDAEINENYDVLYYSFFSDRLLTKNGRYEFLPESSVQDMLPADSVVRILSFIDKAETKRFTRHNKQTSQHSLPRITLSNGVIYDENIENYRYRDNMPEPYTSPYYPDIACHDPPKWGPYDTARKYYLTSHKEGVQFIPAGQVEEDMVREDSWLLLQGLDEPRIVSKYCQFLGATILPVRVYRYYEYSFVRISDDVIPLPDGTFLFVGTGGWHSFSTFHIVRMQPDMGIPIELSSRYRWVRYKDYVGILDLYEREELFSVENKTCPLLDAAHPHCVKTGEDGYCSEVKGGYLDYNKKFLSGYLEIAELADRDLPVSDFFYTDSCLNLALRDYVRGEFEIYHCGEGDETVAGLTPCDEREKQ